MSTPSAPTLLKCLSDERTAEVTVVVPTRNAARTLEACLTSLRLQSVPCVIVVVDNHSDDETQAIAGRLADVVAVAGPERSAQRNLGAALAPAPFVGFIDADMVVGGEVVAEAAAALRAGAGAVIVPEHSFGEGFWAEVRAFERSFYVGSDSIEAARFFRWEVFEEAGGFDADGLPGPEDWDLSGRARRLAPVERVTAMIEHDEGRPTLVDLWRKKAYYGPGLGEYVRTHGQASLQALDRPYLRRPSLLLSRGPLLGAGLVLLKTGEAVAAGLGLLRSRTGGGVSNTRLSRTQDHTPAGEEALPTQVAVVSFGPVLQPNSGLPVRANATVRSLTGLGIRVSLVSTSPETRTGRSGEPDTIRTLRRQLRLGFSLEFVRVVRMLAREVDAIVVESALLVPAVLLARRRLPILWDTNECETLHYSRLPPCPAVLARLGAWWVLEQLAARSSAAVVAISEAEAVHWRAYFPTCRDKVFVVPHAPPLRATHPPPRGNGGRGERVVASSDAPSGPTTPDPDPSTTGPRLVFVGATLGKHNAVAAKWLVTTLAPLLPANSSLVLVGEGTDRVVETLASTQTIACTLVGLGFVPDVDAVIATADLCLAPLASGAGVKTKVLHYLAHGKPVVGTRAAFEGIEDAPGVISVPLDALPGAVLDVIGREQRDDERALLATAQSRWLEAHHGERAVSTAWEQVLRACVAPGTDARASHPAPGSLVAARDPVLEETR